MSANSVATGSSIDAWSLTRLIRLTPFSILNLLMTLTFDSDSVTQFGSAQISSRYQTDPQLIRFGAVLSRQRAGTTSASAARGSRRRGRSRPFAILSFTHAHSHLFV